SRTRPRCGGSRMNEFVVGVDGSDHSRMALQWAVTVGSAAGVPVRVVQSWIHPRSAVVPVAAVPVSESEMEEQTRQAITAVVAEMLGSSAAVTTDVLQGPPAAALLQTVTPDSVLVLGSRGRGGFRGLLLGSVSQECVEYATCPVVVVRTDRAVGDGDVILVGKDDSEGAQRALAWAHALAGALAPSCAPSTRGGPWRRSDHPGRANASGPARRTPCGAGRSRSATRSRARRWR